jgi:hypothetical protein
MGIAPLTELLDELLAVFVIREFLELLALDLGYCE